MVPCSFLDDNVDAKHCQILMGRRRKENKINVENVFKNVHAECDRKAIGSILNPSTGFVYQKIRGGGVLNKLLLVALTVIQSTLVVTDTIGTKIGLSVIEKVVIAGVVFSNFLFLGTSAAVRNNGVS